MKFHINTMNGSGMKYNTKEDFLKEVSLMIDDCTDNGGTYFSIEVDADASCFYIEDDGCPFGHDESDDCKNCEYGGVCHYVNGDCVDRN